MVWLFDRASGRDAPIVGWRAPLASSEQLVDVSWSPQADRLLVVASQPLPGGAHQSRAWFVTPAQHADLVVTLPSDVASGTSVWSPDGTHVAFVAHTGTINALCLLGVDGSFRYLADLDPSADPPLGYTPLSWSADGQQMVFVAPHQHPPSAAFDWLAPANQRAIFVAKLEQPTPSALIETTLDTVTFRDDGQLLGLGRAGPDASVGIRMLSGSGEQSQELVQLPLKPGVTYASMWDLSHAQVLVTSRTTPAVNDFWLVRLGMEAEQ
jgi:Tol biopolymer transport system component